MIIRILLTAVAVVHLTSVSLAQPPKDLPFTLVTIDRTPPNNPWYKMVGDVDRDGDMDLIVAGSKGPLVWYANPGWERIQIADGGWDGVNGETADLDGDGDIDIIMGGIVWFENPSVQNVRWKAHHIDNQRAHDIEVADLDGDGRLDVVARDQSAFGQSGNKLYVYYQDQPTDWQRQVSDCPHGEGLKLGDLDRDGDVDIVLGALWYENPGDRGTRWRQRQYTSQWTEPDTKVELADFNQDGRTDIVLTPAELQGERYRVCWYEAPADAKSSEWTEHTMVDSIECVVHSLGVGDVDGDGDIDAVIAEMHQGKDPDEVSILLNEQQGASWHKQVLSNRGSHDIVVVDIDNDGDLDVVGANHGGVHPLELWRND